MRFRIPCLAVLIFLSAPLLAQEAEPQTEAKPLSLRSIDMERSEEKVRIHMMTTEGRALYPATADLLEKKLVEEPNDLDSRLQLLGYYKGKMNEKLFALRKKHILWFIENRPSDAVFATSYVQVDRRFEDESYAEAMKLWDAQIEKHPKDPSILSNAARFALRNDREVAIRYLVRAKELEPEAPEWARRLAGVYELTAFFGRSKPGSPVRTSIYEEWKLVHKLTKDPLDLQRQYPKLALTAMWAQDFEAARGWAEKALASVETLKTKNLHGEAVHDGNTVLGRLALREGDVEEAKRRLLAAGETIGSPTLNTFGPNLILAERLAAAGQSETVIAYLELCKKYWVGHRDRIAEWIQILKEGDTPHFGNNRLI